MATMSSAEPAFSESVRSRSAHVLSGLLALQGVAAGGGLAWLYLDGASITGILPVFFLVVAVVSLIAAILEWTRNRYAEGVATFALLAGFGLILAAVLAGLWYLVPFVALTTIAAIFGLVDRFAVRDEGKHLPKH